MNGSHIADHHAPQPVQLRPVEDTVINPASRGAVRLGTQPRKRRSGCRSATRWPCDAVAAAPRHRPQDSAWRWWRDSVSTHNVWINVWRCCGAFQQNRKPPLNCSEAAFRIGVADGTRTRDSQDHNLVLYQLNYSHHHHLRGAVDISRFRSLRPNRFPPRRWPPQIRVRPTQPPPRRFRW